MPTVPVPPSRLPVCTQSCEAVNWALEQSAVRAHVIRRLASAIHRTHSKPDTLSWQNCSHQHCKLAHDCVEGELQLGRPNERGQITTVVPIKREA